LRGLGATATSGDVSVGFMGIVYEVGDGGGDGGDGGYAF